MSVPCEPSAPDVFDAAGMRQSGPHATHMYCHKKKDYDQSMWLEATLLFLDLEKILATAELQIIEARKLLPDNVFTGETREVISGLEDDLMAWLARVLTYHGVPPEKYKDARSLSKNASLLTVKRTAWKHGGMLHVDLDHFTIEFRSIDQNRDSGGFMMQGQRCQHSQQTMNIELLLKEMTKFKEHVIEFL